MYIYTSFLNRQCQCKKHINWQGKVWKTLHTYVCLTSVAFYWSAFADIQMWFPPRLSAALLYEVLCWLFCTVCSSLGSIHLKHRLISPKVLVLVIQPSYIYFLCILYLFFWFASLLIRIFFFYATLMRPADLNLLSTVCVHWFLYCFTQWVSQFRSSEASVSQGGKLASTGLLE